MKLSISAIASNYSWNGKNCFSIFITPKKEEVEYNLKLKESWHPFAFPIKDNTQGSFASQKEYINKIFSSRKEIGFYCVSEDLLLIDKELFSQYISLDCEIQNALKKILLRCMPKVLEFK